MKNLAHRFPIDVDHDGAAAMNPPEDCIFLTAPSNTPSGERFAVINHDLPDATELAQEIKRRVNMHDKLVAALKLTYDRYGRLHDAINDCIEGDRMNESNLPDDYRAIVDLLVACLDADVSTKAVIDELAGEPAVPPAPQCLVDAAALLNSLGLGPMVAKDAAELGVPLKRKE